MLHALQVFESIPGLFEAENPPINHWLNIVGFNCTIHLLKLHARAHVCDTCSAEPEKHVHKNWLLFRVSTSPYSNDRDKSVHLHGNQGLLNSDKLAVAHQKHASPFYTCFRV